MIWDYAVLTERIFTTFGLWTINPFAKSLPWSYAWSMACFNRWRVARSVGHFERRCLAKKRIYRILIQKNFEESILLIFFFSTVSYGLALLGAKTSANTVVVEFGGRSHSRPASKGLTGVTRPLGFVDSLTFWLTHWLNLLTECYRPTRVSGFMMTSSNGNIFNGSLYGEFTGHRWIPLTRPVTRSSDVFFHLHLNKRLNKQSWGWWFETLSHSFWRLCNVTFVVLNFSEIIRYHAIYLLCPLVSWQRKEPGYR